EGTDEIDDLYHAAVNGKGEYYDAKSTSELSTALKSAVQKASSDAQGGSNVSFNTGSLEEGSRIYSAEFNPATWAGTVQAESLTDAGLVDELDWDAATELNARNLATDPRKILTYNPGTRTGTAFQWNKLTTAQKNDLKVDADEATAQLRLAFLRGDTSEYVDLFRDREGQRLGATIIVA